MAIHDVHSYLRTMEGAIIGALAEEGIEARSRHGEGIDFTGVWVGERKIASIGVHVSRGVTTHGFAVNVHDDLEPFSWIVAVRRVGRPHRRRFVDTTPASTCRASSTARANAYTHYGYQNSG